MSDEKPPKIVMLCEKCGTGFLRMPESGMIHNMPALMMLQGGTRTQLSPICRGDIRQYPVVYKRRKSKTVIT